MSFQDRVWDTALAKAPWLLEMADRWNERDAKFADQLRVKARQLGGAGDRQAVRRLIQKRRTHLS
jgi:hypothetical protein